MPVASQGNNNIVDLCLSANPGIVARVNIRIQGNNNRVQLNGELTGKGQLSITLLASDCSITIGKQVNINRGLEINVIPAGGGTPSRDCHVEIGDHCLFNGINSLVLAEYGNRISIGSGCLLAHGITFNTSDSHPIFDLDSNARINPCADIAIADRVWVGSDAHFLKKARVAEGSVVAAHSIVTRAFEQPHVVIAGNPARIVRENIRWELDAPAAPE